MLVIRFYGSKGRAFQTRPFQSRQIRDKIHRASTILSLCPSMSGYTIYEIVGSDLIPYHPFNGEARHDRGKAIRL